MKQRLSRLLLLLAGSMGCSARIVELDRTPPATKKPAPETDVVATGLINGILVDETHLYWRELEETDMFAAKIRGCRKDACPSTTVTYGGDNTGAYMDPEIPFSVAAGTVCWASWSNHDGPAYTTAVASIDCCPREGCDSPRTVIDGLADVTGLAVDDTNVYWYTQGDDALLRCGLGGCEAPQLLAVGVWLTASDDRYVYGVGKEIARVRKDGSEKAQILQPVLQENTGEQPHLAIDDQRIYWGPDGGGRLVSCPLDGCNGSPPTLLARGIGRLDALVASGSELFWIEGWPDPARAFRGAKESFEASPRAVGGQNVKGIAVDETSVYWLDEVPTERDPPRYEVRTIHRSAR
jgi:hypothetical protein